MDTIFEQDKHMLTFMEGVEKGESDFLLGLDDPTSVYKARFEKNEEDNFVLKSSVPEGSDFNAEYFFSKPAVLFVPNKIQIQLLNTDALRFTQTINEKGPQGTWLGTSGCVGELYDIEFILNLKLML